MIQSSVLRLRLWNTCKMCTLYKYLLYTLQCRSVESTKKFDLNLPVNEMTKAALSYSAKVKAIWRTKSLFIKHYTWQKLITILAFNESLCRVYLQDPRIVIESFAMRNGQ